CSRDAQWSATGSGARLLELEMGWADCRSVRRTRIFLPVLFRQQWAGFQGTPQCCSKGIHPGPADPEPCPSSLTVLDSVADHGRNGEWAQTLGLGNVSLSGIRVQGRGPVRRAMANREVGLTLPWRGR